MRPGARCEAGGGCEAEGGCAAGCGCEAEEAGCEVRVGSLGGDSYHGLPSHCTGPRVVTGDDG